MSAADTLALILGGTVPYTVSDDETWGETLEIDWRTVTEGGYDAEQWLTERAALVDAGSAA